MMLLRATLALNGRLNGQMVGPTSTIWLSLTDAGWEELALDEATRIQRNFRAFTWETRHEGAAQLQQRLERALVHSFPGGSDSRRVEMVTGGPHGSDVTFWMTFPHGVPLDADLVHSLPTLPFHELPSHRLIELELEPIPGRWPARASAA